MAKAIVPATTANLGPGFDVLGLALNLYNAFTVEEIEDGLEISILPENSVKLAQNEKNLVYRAAKRLFDEVGFKPAGLKITIENGVPMGRGLGSSSTAIVGGLAAANVLAKANIPKEEIFVLATELEGHPDNVGPAVFGGFTICYPVDAKFKAARYKPAENLQPLVLIPDSTLETRRARGVLPQEVKIKDAVFNISRSSLLVSALLVGDAGLLKEAMQDRLHQPYRAPLIPGLLEVIEEIGCISGVGVALSGAGPSLICVSERSVAAAFYEQVQEMLVKKQNGYSAKLVDFDLQGVRTEN